MNRSSMMMYLMPARELFRAVEAVQRAAADEEAPLTGCSRSSKAVTEKHGGVIEVQLSRACRPEHHRAQWLATVLEVEFDDIVPITLPLIERVWGYNGDLSDGVGAGFSFLGVGNPPRPSLQLLLDLSRSNAGPVVVGVPPCVLLLLFPGGAASPHVRPVHPLVGLA